MWKCGKRWHYFKTLESGILLCDECDVETKNDSNVGAHKNRADLYDEYDNVAYDEDALRHHWKIFHLDPGHNEWIEEINDNDLGDHRNMAHLNLRRLTVVNVKL